ncbi:MAG: hypothetical protein ACJA01_003392, partial [Saprospiraceae bacterium]
TKDGEIYTYNKNVLYVFRCVPTLDPQGRHPHPLICQSALPLSTVPYMVMPFNPVNPIIF